MKVVFLTSWLCLNQVIHSLIYGSNICAVIVIVDTEAAADQSKTQHCVYGKLRKMNIPKS